MYLIMAGNASASPTRLSSVLAAAKVAWRNPNNARWAVHTQGQAPARISARRGEVSAVSWDGVTGGSIAFPPATQRVHRTFLGEPGQVPQARDFVRCSVPERVCSAQAAEDILVCATELAANAVLHSRSGLPGGHFSVEVAICARQWVRVAVEDSGGPWAERGTSDGDTESGRGLHIVSALSAAAGIIGDASGRTAWFCSRWGTGPPEWPVSSSVRP
jgi:anti-sigma regulatory factor (Ser/Thr protein kinase)